MVAHVVRILLSALLLSGVYSEAGLWTTIAVGLVYLKNELVGFRLL